MKPNNLGWLVALIYIFCSTQVFSQQVCLNNAWKAFNSENYKEAIKHCDQCIKIFKAKADQMHQELEAQGQSNFPEGVVSDKEKEEIFKNWAINEMATVYYIKGTSAEELYKNNKDKTSYQQMATEAYEQTCKYFLGRCWDPQGWFWSPCEAAKDRLPVKSR